MLTALLVIVVTPLLIVFLAPLTRLRRHAENPNESQAWRPTTAEIVSVLHAGNRTFLLVGYRVGSQIIHNDVRYPLAGPTPTIGQRVPIRYDPLAPARLVFDEQRATAPHGLAA